MKKVILKQLRLLNFKGLRDLTIFFEGTTNISGANRAGKSTVFDSFTWLLWGKDQFDRKDYEIKTLDEKNQPIHQLNHEVEAVFDVNGHEEKPKRIFKEIWTKKRGEAKATFTGHETVYFWNDVPCKAAEYQAKINEIISEGMFKLITNPHYFNALPWDKRRLCLLDMAGTITNTQIFDKIATPANDYGGLINVLNSGKTASDYKKEIGVKKLKIKKELEEIPTRINEAERNMPDSANWEAIGQQIADRENAITSIEESLSDAVKARGRANEVLMEKQNSIYKLKRELGGISFTVRSEIQLEQSKSSQNVTVAESAVRNHEDSIRRTTVLIKQKEDTIQYLKNELDAKQKTLDSCREKWAEINAEEFSFDDSKCICPTCKQDLPEEDIEEQKAIMLQNFTNSVTTRKAEKEREGTQLNADIANINTSLGEAYSAVSSLQTQLENFQVEIRQLKTKLDTQRLVHASKASFDIESAVNEKIAVHPDAISLAMQIEALEQELTANQDPEENINTAELKQQKANLQTELDALKRQLAVKETIDRTNQRIKDLHHEEEILSQELAGYEQQEFEIEKYTKAKMDILESKINERFRMVRFKLFDRQINGGEVECCECLINGVPYAAANTESKINAGLDIINVLCDHYQVSAPVFIDNRESVSEIILTKSQIINLIVNPSFKTLQIMAA